jgi:DNA-binding transcriptional MerR regulator
MTTQALKLKQASAALGVPPKDLQNLVQFGVVRPRRRKSIFVFDFNVLLQAKVAFYLRDSLGASSEVLAAVCAALDGEFKKRRSGNAALTDVYLQARPRWQSEALEIKIPLKSLAEDLQQQLPRAAANKDLPRGRKSPSWREEFTRAMEEASEDLAGITEEEIRRTIQDYRSERKKRLGIAIVATKKEKTA